MTARVRLTMFFFFKQKTAYEIVSRDWSSDVCSSDLLEDHSQAVGIAQAEPAPDRSAEGHDGGAARVLQLAAEHGIVAAVGEHGEPLGDEHLRGAQRLFAVGQQRLLI